MDIHAAQPPGLTQAPSPPAAVRPGQASPTPEALLQWQADLDRTPKSAPRLVATYESPCAKAPDKAVAAATGAVEELESLTKQIGSASSMTSELRPVVKQIGDASAKIENAAGSKDARNIFTAELASRLSSSLENAQQALDKLKPGPKEFVQTTPFTPNGPVQVLVGAKVAVASALQALNDLSDVCVPPARSEPGSVH